MSTTTDNEDGALSQMTPSQLQSLKKAHHTLHNLLRRSFPYFTSASILRWAGVILDHPDYFPIDPYEFSPFFRRFEHPTRFKDFTTIERAAVLSVSRFYRLGGVPGRKPWGARPGPSAYRDTVRDWRSILRLHEVAAGIPLGPGDASHTVPKTRRTPRCVADAHVVPPVGGEKDPDGFVGNPRYVGSGGPESPDPGK